MSSKSGSAHERIDAALVKRGLISSREKAQALIMAGRVFIFEEKATKPSQQVSAEDQLSVRGELEPFVSRGGHKLAKAMDVFAVAAQCVTALDIGASTGGFTDVLLRNGAEHVYAIDVGYGQLDWKLRSDPRVTVMERQNARYITADMFDRQPTLGVTDVSFISIKLILPPALEIIGDRGRFIALIKPQFEAGRERVGKKGVVRDKSVHEDVVASIVEFVPSLGWHVAGLDFSPITGPEGNIEFLADMRPGLPVPELQVTPERIREIVESAWNTLNK